MQISLDVRKRLSEYKEGRISLTTVGLIVISVLLFGFIIFAHEFGHFITAKMFGVKVNEFALGMGPKLFSFQKGETKYALRLFPIGGFCAMEGEDEQSEDPRAFGNKKTWKKIIIVAAGAVMNMIVGYIFCIILLAQSTSFASTTVSQFADDSALEKAGISIGDTFLEIDGYRIRTDRDLSFALALADVNGADITVLRDGEKLYFDDVKFNTREYEGKEVLVIDFYVAPQEKTFFSVMKKGFSETVSITKVVWVSLKGMVTGRFGLNDMAGPVGAAQIITQAASDGLAVNFMTAVNNILYMMIMITVNLGVVNLMPFPALDGGRLLFLLVELVRGKPINPKYEGAVHAVGIVILLAFMVLITFNDIVRIVSGSGIGA